MSVGEKLLDAVEILAANSIEKAGYDRTIQAQIVSCEDATIGKYRCRYQDAIIHAYASNSDVTFNNGSYVYILVPGNDMKKEKTILGTTKKLGINYISQAEGDQAYDFVGNNCVNENASNSAFFLNSNNKDYTYRIYDHNNQTGSSLKLNEEAVTKYIKQSSSLIVGAVFKTSIPQKRQYRGHYGITYYLKFFDNVYNKEVIRLYTIDEDNMIDNPYRLVYPTRQYQIFDIDGSNFINVQYIEIFNKNFPDATGTVTTGAISSENADIEISSIELNGAIRMSESEINGVAISFYTPQGTFFTSSSSGDGKGSQKTITAQVRVKGKLVSSAQNIPFYWGIENINILPSSEYYNKHLGRGWKCLNDKNIVMAKTETRDPVIEWIPYGDTYIFKFEEATARDNRMKVAIVYDSNIITKEINIQNLSSGTPVITIESDAGTKFYYDNGHPTLTCKVNSGEPSNYKYYWAYESNTGIFSELPVTTDVNTRYASAVKTLNDLKAAIANGTKFANAEATNLNNAETAVKAFDFIQRVQGNKVYNVQINNITSFGTFKCSVYNDKDTYLGTAAITLTNTLEGEDLYSLVINNGSAVFQYNENGVAPNNKSLDVQQDIQGLSFTIYDNLGQPIDSEIIAQQCKIRWQFPIKDTMLVDTQGGQSAGNDPQLNYKYYDNVLNLVYGIAQKYDIKKQRNQIKLTVDYKGMNLTAETDFTFAKQGEPGTNGTEFIVRLVPNTKMSNPPLWPMITQTKAVTTHSKPGGGVINPGETIYYLNFGHLNSNNESLLFTSGGSQLFKAQLWHSGELIWEGFSTNDNPTSYQIKPTSVYWEVLKNKYNSSISDQAAFEITSANANAGWIRYLGKDLTVNNIYIPRASIIKCTIQWQGKSYYGTIPIILAWTYNENFRVRLKDYSGFRYVIYTSDGVTPQYDNSHPFEFVCEEKINGVWEEVTYAGGDYSISVAPQAIGCYFNNGAKYNSEKINSNLLKISKWSPAGGLKPNQYWITPVSRYDGVCINEAVCCTYINKNNTIIGRINIPIHFLLNKYGMAHINEWDGNSVQLNNDGGYILAPQMGAGTKSSGAFTGVLMGEVREPSNSTAQVGLLGYHNGVRSFFLNSKNGSALFGTSGKSQIVIDPSSGGDGMIYSGNFWKTSSWNTSGDRAGLPTSYSYRTDPNDSNPNQPFQPSGDCSGNGLLINLSKPEIFFGSGNFYVTKEGWIHAAAGGDIAGWKIGTEDISGVKHSVLYSNVTKANGRITLDAGTLNTTTKVVSGPGKIYSHSHDSLTNYGTGFYLSYNGLSIGGKAKLTSQGIMYLGGNAVANGGISDNKTRIRNYWTIDGNNDRSYIAYGGSTAYSQADRDNGTAASVYIGTDGISLGKKFSVNQQGELTSYKGTIGGWTIEKSVLKSSSNKIQLYANGSIQGGLENKTGVNKFNHKWEIKTDGTATFNKLIANNTGQIAGWTISSSALSAKGIIISANGSITAKSGNETKWSISGDGTTYGLEINSGTKVDIQMSGGYIGTSSGHLGSSGASGYSNSAPLSWDSSGVTMRKGAKIGEAEIDSNGVIYNENSKFGKSLIESDTLKANKQLKGPKLTFTVEGGPDTAELDYNFANTVVNNSETGTITFSDGSIITIEYGLITAVKPGSELKYS